MAKGSFVPADKDIRHDFTGGSALASTGGAVRSSTPSFGGEPGWAAGGRGSRGKPVHLTKGPLP